MKPTAINIFGITINENSLYKQQMQNLCNKFIGVYGAVKRCANILLQNLKLVVDEAILKVYLFICVPTGQKQQTSVYRKYRLQNRLLKYIFGLYWYILHKVLEVRRL